MEEGNGMHAGIVARAPLLGLSGLDATARDLMCVASTHNTPPDHEADVINDVFDVCCGSQRNLS